MNKCIIPGIRYDTAAVRSTWYAIPPVPGTRIFIRTSTAFYFGKRRKKSVSPARSVILIHGSALCMYEERPTKLASPNKAMSGRLVLLLSLLITAATAAARFATAAAVLMPTP